MFILSGIRRHRVAVLVMVGLVLAGIVGGVCHMRRQKDFRTFDGRTVCLLVYDEDSARQTAAFFDTAAQKAAVSCEEVRIPVRFNEVYDRYNALQEAFGSNLADYRGRVCQKYSFALGRDSGQESRTLTLLVCDGHLIGGDCSDNAFDGEMCGLVS